MSVRDVILWEFLGGQIGVGITCTDSVVPPKLESPKLTAACSVCLQPSYFILFLANSQLILETQPIYYSLCQVHFLIVSLPGVGVYPPRTQSTACTFFTVVQSLYICLSTRIRSLQGTMLSSIMSDPCYPQCLDHVSNNLQACRTTADFKGTITILQKTSRWDLKKKKRENYLR